MPAQRTYTRRISSRGVVDFTCLPQSLALGKPLGIMSLIAEGQRERCAVQGCANAASAANLKSVGIVAGFLCLF